MTLTFRLQSKSDSHPPPARHQLPAVDEHVVPSPGILARNVCARTRGCMGVSSHRGCMGASSLCYHSYARMFRLMTPVLLVADLDSVQRFVRSFLSDHSQAVTQRGRYGRFEYIMSVWYNCEICGKLLNLDGSCPNIDRCC